MRAEFWIASAAALAFSPVTFGASPALSKEDINLAADVLNSDARNDIHVMSGNVRITQGDMLMEAEQATAKGLQTDHSNWSFERDVHLRSAAADLRSNTANAVFANGVIAEATVRGTPATFEQRNGTADKSARGRANVIQYDFAKSTITMTQDVWFSYGGNEFRGDTVVYNLRDERVVVNPSGTSSSGTGRVNITIRPGSGITLPGAQPKHPPAPAPEKKE
ncbi:MAG: LptA/OstA family protein [Povalibacter sp.]